MSTDSKDLDAAYGQYTEAEATELARERGWAVRVTRRDENRLVATPDFRADRLNIEIEKNRVVSARVG